MTSKKLFEELNNVDDNLIEEASDYTGAIREKQHHFTKSNIFRVASIAAAACLVVCIGFGINRFGMGDSQERDTESGIEETIVHVEETMWYRTDELVYFGGHMYRESKNSPYLTGETIEETVLKKGELLGSVEDSKEYGESIYKGCPIYRVEGKKGINKIIVEKDGELILFSLHEWLYTPDIAEQLKMYGALTAADIQSVKVKWNRANGGIGDYQSEEVLTDTATIEALYNILNTLVLDIDGYNEILKTIADADYKVWKDAGGGEVVEMQTAAEGGGMYVSGYRGTTAFDNSVQIELLTGDNEELRYQYYPKMGYLERYKATQELIDWITENTNK